MDTTCNNEETPRPEPRCPRCGSSEDAPNDRDLCENCVDELDVEYDAGPEPDFDAYSDGMGDFEPATGYEADDERPYGWDVPEEEYPDW